MAFIVASQFESEFNDGLRALPIGATVIPVPEERPWEAANDADVLLVRPSPAWRANRTAPRPSGWPGRARWICSGSVGIDFYPPWLLEAPYVSCGRGVASDEIADYVVSAIYHQAKNLEAVRAHSLDQWVQAPLGRVAGSTIGLIGFGAIGQAVARRGLALGTRVAAVRRRELPSAVIGVDLLDSIEAVFAASDHIVLALPSTAETRGLIGAEPLGHAKLGAHLINVARGAVLNQAALIAALDAGRLGFATLDVTEPEPLPADHPLWRHPLVRLTPHVSSNYTQVRDMLFAKVSADLDRFVRGEAPSDLVDPVAGY